MSESGLSLPFPMKTPHSMPPPYPFLLRAPHGLLNPGSDQNGSGPYPAAAPFLGLPGFRGPPLLPPHLFSGPPGLFGGMPPELLYKTDPRMLNHPFFREEPKPNHSYIGLIAMAILSAKEKKMVLSDIYQWILDNYSYFRSRGPGWRNSIRHNLSLNDCFIKVGRSSNGKGHYWSIHPANLEDFKRGDFRRRRAQRKVRKAMGLVCPDDEDTPSPSPGPTDDKSFSWGAPDLASMEDDLDRTDTKGENLEDSEEPDLSPDKERSELLEGTLMDKPQSSSPNNSRKRGFDMASLLAPETKLARLGAVAAASLSPGKSGLPPQSAGFPLYPGPNPAEQFLLWHQAYMQAASKFQQQQTANCDSDINDNS